MKLFNKCIKSDVASATLTTGIISLLLICLCFGFGLDITKNAYLKNVQDSQSQQAAETAIKSINSQGSLLNYTKDQNGIVPDAVYDFATEYKSQNSSNYNNALVGMGQHDDESSTYKFGKCLTRDIKQYGSDVATPTKMPYIIVSLDPDRQVGNSENKLVYTIEGNDKPKLVSGTANSAVKYKVLGAEVHDASINFMLGIFNMPCQNLTSKASAITFGSQTDLSNN